jgi:hypothetical protein
MTEKENEVPALTQALDVLDLEDDDLVLVPIAAPKQEKKPPVFNKNLYAMPSERQQDFFVEDRQLFWRPYCDDLFKTILQAPSRPKVLVAAELPRTALIHLLV